MHIALQLKMCASQNVHCIAFQNAHFVQSSSLIAKSVYMVEKSTYINLGRLQTRSTKYQITVWHRSTKSDIQTITRLEPSRRVPKKLWSTSMGSGHINRSSTLGKREKKGVSLESSVGT